MPLIHLNFQLQRDIIARTLCINRDQPQLQCHGKCFLKKQLKAQAAHESQSAEIRKSPLEVVWYCPVAELWELPPSIVEKEAQTVGAEVSLISRYRSPHWQPPRVSHQV